MRLISVATTALALTALALFSLGVPGCKKQAGVSSGGNEILIGEYGSMSGSESTFGKSTHEGIQLATDEANAAGGVLGKQVKIIAEDDSGKQDEAVTVVKKLINRDN